MIYIDFDQFENPEGHLEEEVSELNSLEDRLFLLQELEMYYHEAALTVNEYAKLADIAEMNINNQAALNTVREKITQTKDQIGDIWYMKGGDL